jgi:hypothetical protein
MVSYGEGAHIFVVAYGGPVTQTVGGGCKAGLIHSLFALLWVFCYQGPVCVDGPIRCQNVPGGIVTDGYREAAQRLFCPAAF